STRSSKRCRPPSVDGPAGGIAHSPWGAKGGKGHSLYRATSHTPCRPLPLVGPGAGLGETGPRRWRANRRSAPRRSLRRPLLSPVAAPAPDAFAVTPRGNWAALQAVADVVWEGPHSRDWVRRPPPGRWAR